ncbi:DUF5689 domain-containing protein [Flavobacterium sp. PLA-1-15]|uniref:DUF5689 domain-containing protein n=1 Tax=Flavobacterium sp. PLA-1-15 TaxID=3380533 RepID=UPI003B7F2579
MKTNFLKSILYVALSAGILTSCVNDDDYGTPNLDKFNCVEAASITPTKTIQEIFDIANAAAGLPVKYPDNDIITAIVVSADKGGNFFKTMHLQSEDKAIALTALIDIENYSAEYQSGRKVFINLKDRYVQIKDGGLLIGELDGNSVFRIARPLVFPTIPRTCDDLKNDDDLVTGLTITEAIASNLHLNKLVEFTGVQFLTSAVGKPYHIPTNGTSGTNHTITDATGKTIIVRSTSFSKYAVNLVPGNSGTIRGILTRFGSTYQFTPRTESDIKLTEERFYINTQLGGTEIAYLGSFTENFESYALNNRIFPKYLNDSYIGARYWEVKQFPPNTGNKYIQMSSNASNEVNKTFFYVPVDMTAANTLSFKTKDGFNNGAVLKVWYTTNYTPGTDISNATLVDITSQFTIASGTTTGYAVNFTNSGVYNIPATVTGNGFFIFEYTGNGAGSALTTTMQIDDITVN